MSVDITELLNRQLLNIPSVYRDELTEQGPDFVSNGLMISDVAQAEQYRFLSLLMKAADHALVTSDEKPEIELGEQIKLLRPPRNCIDSTLATLGVCTELGIDAYASFQGSHASVVLPLNDEACWVLDGDPRQKEKPNQGTAPYLQWKFGNLPPGDTTQASVYFGVLQGETIAYSMRRLPAIDADQTRAQTRAFAKEVSVENGKPVTCGMILLPGTIATMCLTAIELLEIVGEHSCKNQKAMNEYIRCKQALSPYVPQLRYRQQQS